MVYGREDRIVARLHIGGWVRREGWENFDILPAPHVDHIGDFRDLSAFPDGVLEAIYASHVLEHVGFRDVVPALKEWLRVLAPYGIVMISVPNLEVLCRHFSDPRLTDSERSYLMQVMFGSQADKYDFHHTGFYPDLLAGMLALAGFTEIQQVQNFGIFSDSSEHTFHGVPISLNVTARKPGSSVEKIK